MRGKAPLFLGILFLVLAITAGIGFYLLSSQGQLPSQPAVSTNSSLTPTLVPTIVPQETQPISQDDFPTGWNVYTSSEYGFKIAYPDDYQALDDTDNLYGYPNGVVLFYKGGQAYDVVIEVWDNQVDYETKYGPQINDLTVKQVGIKYITLLNNTQSLKNLTLIETFKPL